MEVCYYCKEIINNSDPVTKGAMPQSEVLNLYHTTCFKKREKNYKYTHYSKKETKKSSKLFWNLLYSMAGLFFCELLAIIIIIVIQKS